MHRVSERKSYGQFCGLARALDRVGDRWTLLVVRELLLEDRSFRDLERALPGISPSLLTKRLAELGTDGLLARNDAPRRSKAVTYRLTEAGRSLEPVILELIRWGSTWMFCGPGDDRVDPRWAPLALRALLEGRTSRRGRLHVDVDGVPVTIDSTRGRVHVRAGHHGRPDAHVAATLPALLAVAATGQSLQSSGIAVAGDAGVAGALLAVNAADRP